MRKRSPSRRRAFGAAPLAAFLSAALLLAFGPAARAQVNEPAVPGTWRAYPSLREVSALDASGTEVWAATSGGVFAYAPGTGEVRRFSTIDGLQGVNARAIVQDAERGAVWVGYEAGGLDRIGGDGAIEPFFDVARAEQYPRRNVNRLLVQGDSLWIATDFGLVVFDPVRGVVRDSYTRFGELPGGTAVYDALVAPIPDGPDAGAQGLWLATAEGVVRARLGPGLQQPTAWTVELRRQFAQFGDSTAIPFRSLAYFNGQVVASADTTGLRVNLSLPAVDTYVRNADGTWTALGYRGSTLDLTVAGDQLLFLRPREVRQRDLAGGSLTYTYDTYETLTAIDVAPDGTVWLGDRQQGLFRASRSGSGGAVVVPEGDRVVPAGPFSNVVGALDVGPDGTVWFAHARQLAGGVLYAGISRLDEAGWRVYDSRTDPISVGEGGFLSAHAAADGTFYAGTYGDAMSYVAPDGTVGKYDASNSSLRDFAGQAGTYIIAPDAVTDAAGRLWVVSLSGSPLHVRDTDGTWTALPPPPGLPAAAIPYGLYIDRFDQKWIFLRSATGLGTGRGIAVVSTGTTPRDPSDDRAVQYVGQIGNGSGLPNDLVYDFAEDGEGGVWIGTERGVGVVSTPGSVFGGDPALATPQWPTIGEGDSTSFFLRDFTVNAFDADPAGRLWLATESGALLIDPEAPAILQQFTTTNSPLYSNNVIDVAVDAASGRVYFVTERGVLSYDADATAPVATAEELDVFPAPFRPAEHTDGVLISGLVAATDVRILTIDGRLVAQLDGRGGTARWDGRDSSGAEVPSGVYLVAARGLDGEGTAYGKVAVLR